MIHVHPAIHVRQGGGGASDACISQPQHACWVRRCPRPTKQSTDVLSPPLSRVNLLKQAQAELVKKRMREATGGGQKGAKRRGVFMAADDDDDDEEEQEEEEDLDWRRKAA